MQLSQGFKALLRHSRAASPLGGTPTVAVRYAISSSAAIGSSQEGPSEEGQAPLPNFTATSGTEDPHDVAARVGPGSKAEPAGIENPNEGPGDYSQPQIQSDAYARGGDNNDMSPGQRQTMVANASEETKGDRAGQQPQSAAPGGSSSRGPDADSQADGAAAATAGPLGRLVPPSQVPAEGADLPPGHDASGSTLESTAAQSDA
ncbi:hypothetical protein PLESTB_001610200 [Pleodorina starrii]|uniref:Uncharacterized protein n=1 Tax=Pleodorina starrii TaxID=330485 RepID=A0A9W6F8M4_9CHLO|nr:hypothetical protein PLESTB_001610200 [Pleodorina starrii]GLC64148.1 hypothetical protein PLESTF_000129600 [Pleodorina starrii]